MRKFVFYALFFYFLNINQSKKLTLVVQGVFMYESNTREKLGFLISE